MNTTALSRKHLEANGYHVERVEHYDHFKRRTNDLWGFVDLLCIHQDTGELLAVQTTSYSNVAARIRKITESPLLPLVRRSGIRLLVHGWRKVKNRWTLRTEDIS